MTPRSLGYLNSKCFNSDQFSKNLNIQSNNYHKWQCFTEAVTRTVTTQPWTSPCPSVRCVGTWRGANTTRSSAATAARDSSRGTTPSQISSSAARLADVRWTEGTGPCANSADCKNASMSACRSMAMGPRQVNLTHRRCPFPPTPTSSSSLGFSFILVQLKAYKCIYLRIVK